MTKILAIDPGSKLAYSIWDKGELLSYEEFSSPATMGLLERLALMEFNIDELLREYRPKYLMIEDVTKGSHKSWQARVWLLYTCLYAQVRAHLLDVEVLSVAPTTMKKLITGSGRAVKSDVVHAVNEKMGLSLKPSKHNLADAIAFGIVAHKKLNLGIAKCK